MEGIYTLGIGSLCIHTVISSFIYVLSVHHGSSCCTLLDGKPNKNKGRSSMHATKYDNTTRTANNDVENVQATYCCV